MGDCPVPSLWVQDLRLLRKFAEGPLRNSHAELRNVYLGRYTLQASGRVAYQPSQAMAPNMANALAEGPSTPLGWGAFVCVSVDARSRSAQSQSLWSNHRSPQVYDTATGRALERWSASGPSHVRTPFPIRLFIEPASSRSVAASRIGSG